MVKFKPSCNLVSIKMIRNTKIVLKGFDTKKEACLLDMPPNMDYSDLTIRINQQIDIGLQPLNIAEVLAMRQIAILRIHSDASLVSTSSRSLYNSLERIQIALMANQFEREYI